MNNTKQELDSNITIPSTNETKNATNSKKKEVPPAETLLNLCHSLLRFIDRKVVKKYIYPNVAQLPKLLRNKDIKIKINKKSMGILFKRRRN